MISTRDFVYTPSHRQDGTYHSLYYPVMDHWLEFKIAHWVHHEGSIRQLTGLWADALPQSDILLLKGSSTDLIKYHVTDNLILEYFLSIINRNKQG